MDCFEQPMRLLVVY